MLPGDVVDFDVDAALCVIPKFAGSEVDGFIKEGTPKSEQAVGGTGTVGDKDGQMVALWLLVQPTVVRVSLMPMPWELVAKVRAFSGGRSAAPQKFCG